MLRRFSSAASPVSFPLLLFALLILLPNVTAQQYPEKIDGYKVHHADVEVVSENEKDIEQDGDGTTVVLALGEPELAGISLFGVTIDLYCRLKVTGQSGEIDYLVFRDVIVNGTRVEIEEYDHPFKFKKSERFELGYPLKMFVGSVGTLRAALSELTNSKDEWIVTGTVLVFGRFKKSFFKFKRVIPVRLDFTIRNPVSY